MKAITTILGIILYCQSYSQCKYLKDEVDPFTKQHIQFTGGNIWKGGFMSTGRIDFKFKEISDTLYYSFLFNSNLSGIVTVHTTDAATLLFTDSTTLSLSPTASIVGEYTNIANNIVYWIEPMYYITKEQIKYISSHTVSAIRISVDGVNNDYIIKSSKAKDISVAAGCILN